MHKLYLLPSNNLNFKSSKELDLSISHLFYNNKNIETLKNNYYSTYSQLFDKIEKINLSKTEKMYAFFDCFDFSHKELSDLLNVSLRTIETNFYRMRKKMTKNN